MARKRLKRMAFCTRIGALALIAAAYLLAPTATNNVTVLAAHLTGSPATYTLDADFDEGTLINVVHDPSDQLQLDDTTEPFNFIWVAVSSKGTVVKINTQTGTVLGEYKTAPDGRGLNPSRTTVDNNGNVWVGNRNEDGWVNINAISPGVPATTRQMGSVVHIGLNENGQCVDRDGSGTIETSAGLGDIRAWPGGPDDLGGVSAAADECILHYTRVNSRGTRHVSVDANNDVWVSGLTYRAFDLIDGDTGTIIRQEPPAATYLGGYGGLIDGNGVIWSARSLLRWDTALPLIAGNWTGYGHDSYGLCIDSQGNVWNTAFYGNIIRKFAPNGTLIGTYNHGNYYAQGCVVDQNDHVWVAHSLLGSSNTVGHILNDGTYIGNVTVGSAPTGVAVDAAGKIWATNLYSWTVSRIDPSLGPTGADGTTPVGAVDFTTVNLGGQLYNYSDMTGSTLTGAPDAGTWTIIHDTGISGVEWGNVSWTSDEPGDSSIVVEVASSNDGTNFGPDETASNGGDLSVANGQYLRVTVSFTRSTLDEDQNGTNDSPILYDLTIEAITNEPPVAVCEDVEVSADESCVAEADVDGGSYDPDEGDDITLDQDPAGPYSLGDTEVTLTVTDLEGETDTCTATVTVIDTTPPEVPACNSPPTMIPPDAPASFTATSDDNCTSAVDVRITGYDCYFENGTGEIIDKTESCVVQFSGATITILDSGGVDDHITWTIQATDESGNTSTTQCEIVVINPGKGKSN